jgi:peptide/nickel transport system permease protein
MVKYILKRLGASLLILLGVSLILYTLLRCMPTDYVEQKILALTTGGVEVQDDMKKKLYEAYGLDGTILHGYWTWLTKIAHLDFGTSFISGREVLSEIFSGDRLGTSFVVAAIATVFEFLIAIPLGITAATHQYSIRDYLVTVLVLIGISLPSFFF